MLRKLYRTTRRRKKARKRGAPVLIPELRTTTTTECTHVHYKYRTGASSLLARPLKMRKSRNFPFSLFCGLVHAAHSRGLFSFLPPRLSLPRRGQSLSLRLSFTPMAIINCTCTRAPCLSLFYSLRALFRGARKNRFDKLVLCLSRAIFKKEDRALEHRAEKERERERDKKGRSRGARWKERN